jgi:hypothetical protein
MKQVEWVMWGCLALSIAALALGYALAGLWVGLAFVLAAGLWYLMRRRRWAWLAHLALALLLLGAGGGILLGAPAGLMLAAVLFALAAWDLEHFLWRLGYLHNLQLAPIVVRRHFTRLATALGTGAVLSAAALLLQLEIKLWVEILFGLAAIYGFSRILMIFRNMEKN